MTDIVHASGVAAIPTRYAGCHFRSRLEARWAVFFDTIGIRWEYEPQGFIGAYGQHYLPDFLLPEIEPPVRSSRMGDVNLECLGTFVEVKGSDRQLQADAKKIGQVIDYRETPVAHGLLLLGPVPDATDDRIGEIGHSFLSWHKGVDHSVVRFTLTQPIDPATGRAALGGRLRSKPTPSLIVSGVGRYYDGNTSDTLPHHATVEAFMFAHQLSSSRRPDPRIVAAYTAARSARFEHGQSGAA